jgi:AbrB family looped-hinge helix DNA binding protein
MQEHRVKIGEGGRVIIPAYYRKALGVQPGDELVIRLQNGELRLFQQTKALERLRSALKENDVTLSVKDFLAFRRQDSGI